MDSIEIFQINVSKNVFGDLSQKKLAETISEIFALLLSVIQVRTPPDIPAGFPPGVPYMYTTRHFL